MNIKKLSFVLLMLGLSAGIALVACGNADSDQDKPENEGDKQPEGPFKVDEDNNSLLWRISGNGLKEPSYLYGTIHIMDKRVFAWPDELWELFYANETFALEVKFNTMEEIMEVQKKQLLPEGVKFEDLFSPEDVKIMEEKFKGTGISVGQIKGLKPFFSASTYIAMSMEKEMPMPLDKYLEQKATVKKMEIRGLEAIDEQIDAIDQAMNLEQQAEFFMDVLRGENDFMGDINNQCRLYLKGATDSLYLMLAQDTTMPEGFTEIMITRRNKNMANAADKLIKEDLEKTAFIAIGSGHLSGPEGVVHFLREKGYTVEPLEFEFVNEEEKEKESEGK